MTERRLGDVRDTANGEVSLLEKVKSIEKDFLRMASLRSDDLSLVDEILPPEGSNNISNTLSTSQTVPSVVYEWPSFKKNRAMLAAALTLTAFTAACTMLISAMCYFCGIWGGIIVWLGAELGFFAFQKGLYSYLNCQPMRHEPEDHDGWDTFRRFLRSCGVHNDDGKPIFNPRDYICRWFLGARIKDIKRENVLELLAYGFWYKTRKEMLEDGMAGVLEEMLTQFESVTGLSFEEGYNSSLRFMGHLWEDLHCVFRPMVFYILTEFAGVLCTNILLALGFETKSLGGVYRSYTFPGRHAFHPPQRTATTTNGNTDANASEIFSMPIVFLHGVGLGVLPYLDFVSSLVCTGHPVVVVEYRHVSMRLVTQIPSCAEVAATVIAELDRLKISKACFVGHSYGTFVLTRIVKAYPERVHACSFIDPVCLGMFLPQLLNSFVYLPARCDNVLDFARDLLRFCVSREMGVSATMARRFAWSDINLWPEYLFGHRCLIVFSGKDILVPSKEMLPIIRQETQWIKSIRTLYHPKLGHGEFLACTSWKLEIINEICSLMSPDLERSKDEVRREKVARRKSFILSLNALQDVENRFLQRIDNVFFESVRRTLSLPWTFERHSDH